MNYTRRTSLRSMASSGGIRANSGSSSGVSSGGYVYRGTNRTTEDEITKGRRVQEGLKGTKLTEEEIQERIREFRDVLQFRPNARVNVNDRCNTRGISVKGMTLVERFEAVLRYDNEKGKIKANATHSA